MDCSFKGDSVPVAGPAPGSAAAPTMRQWRMRLVYPDPELVSDAVRIRKWSFDDLDCIETAGRDPEIPKGTTVPAVFTVAEGRAFVERQWSRNDDGQALALAVAEAGSNDAVGHMYLGSTRVERQCRLGYWLIPDARRQGIGTSAIRLISRWVLTENEVYRLVAEVHPDNLASRRLLEKCGFSLEGTLRSWLWIDDQPHDALQYSLLRFDLSHE
ncbi:MAG: GNAT family N-acetyltransferase [bacterium]|nr:GNAT family N-acetyltransferase [bacterium]